MSEKIKSKKELEVLENEFKALQKVAGDEANKVIAIDKKGINFDIFSALKAALKLPGAKVDREKFLRKELIPYFEISKIDVAVNDNPAKAGMPLKIINKIADNVIAYHKNIVSGLSFVTGLPGGFTYMVPALSVDIVQYFYHIIKVVQKLAYLYGFDEFEFDDKDINSDTMNKILIFMGTMYGVNGANEGIKILSKVAEKNISKTIAKQALTKGTIYPIAKKILKTIGIKITKQLFADAVGKVIPIIGGLISGTITFTSFGANCNELKKCLSKNEIANPSFYKKSKENYRTTYKNSLKLSSYKSELDKPLK